MTMNTVLAAAIHDPDGYLLTPIERHAPALMRLFPRIALNISESTSPAFVEAVRTYLNAEIMFHRPDEAEIGRFRRDAVKLGMQSDFVLYSDIDHIFRWIEFGADDLRQVLASHGDTDMLVIGRSPDAFTGEPRRLRETERLVNHIYALMTGESWDLLTAVRRMSRRAAETIVSQSKVDTLANDVEWPLLAQRSGMSVGYMASDALFYRSTEEYGATADTGDGDPLQWIRRVEFAALQATAMRSFL